MWRTVDWEALEHQRMPDPPTNGWYEASTKARHYYCACYYRDILGPHWEPGTIHCIGLYSDKYAQRDRPCEGCEAPEPTCND
jgi:hypothetical protein